MNFFKKIIIFFLSIILIGACAYTIEDRKKTERDFPDSLRKYNSPTTNMKAQLIGDRTLGVYQPVSHDKYIAHLFEKNPNDDFILYSSTILGTMDQSNNFTPEKYITAGSNKEFAIRARPAKSKGNYTWFPEHENIGSVFAINQGIKFDNKYVNIYTPSKIANVNSVIIQQSMDLIYPESKESIASLELETIVDKSGVTFHGEIDWKQSVEIERGYVGMLPTIVPPMQYLLTSDGSRYELLSENHTDITNSREINYFSFVSKTFEDNGKALNVVLTGEIHNGEDTLRLTEEGTREPEIIWLEHRSESVQKVYPQVYHNYITSENEIFDFSTTIYTGLYPTERLED